MSSYHDSKCSDERLVRPSKHLSVSVGGFQFEGSMWEAGALVFGLVIVLVIMTNWITAEQVIELLATLR